LAWRLREHPDVASLTHITTKVPGSLLITRLIGLFRQDHDPSEGNRVWNRFLCHDDDSLTKDDVTPYARSFIERVVRNNLVLFRKKRFIMKCPKNSVRVGFLNEIFPDMIFVHLIRDGRAVANSILRKREKHDFEFWGCRPPGWRELQALPILDACALQWKAIVECVLKDAEKLPPERYIEVRYEDYVANPEKTLANVAEKCGLAWEPDHLRQVVQGLENRNYKWREHFSSEEIDRLNSLIGDLLVRLGYEL
jgi:hypothetical protein